MHDRPTSSTATPPPATDFVDRWVHSGGAERANYQLFLAELCDVLEVARPDPTTDDDAQNAYVFERSVRFDNRDGTHSTRRIDLYKRGCFVCETKQGVEAKEDELVLSAKQTARRKNRKKGHGTRGTPAWDDAMYRAAGQAEQYVHALPAEEGRPPFLVVIDVGHSIELYAEFTQTGGTYTPFPDARSHRIKLAQLTDPDVRERLRLVWTDPLSLDPARRTAKVTREIAARLAELAKSLETTGEHRPEDVAHFLMRCLFTMFAEDIGLLPRNKFRELLASLEEPAEFVPVVGDLWQRMNLGGFWVPWRLKLLRFNGNLFADASAIPLTRDQLDLLIEAAKSDWKDVEPAIFGTLLERALDPVERHKLGAHYTPRAYVERLVIPTVVEPLREEWDAVRAAAVTLAKEGNKKAAAAELQKFHDRLCEVRVLDPACGTGNFLYVTLEHLKRLEGEIFDLYESLGERQMLLETGHTVDPHQLLGLEINPRAAAIAELVLWIGYLQWHFRTHGDVSPPEPVIKNFKNIECRDAVLTWTSRQPVLDENGKPVTRWDGRTTKPHPVTGQEVPDESARMLAYKYVNPKKAVWPDADFVVGNPPFVGNKVMVSALGDGYAQALRQAHDDVPESADYVMYWWNSAAILAKSGAIERFGLITTNSITQSFNRRVLLRHLANGNFSLKYVIPDHPWVDSATAAAVRIAMTVAQGREEVGTLCTIIRDKDEPAENNSGEASVELICNEGEIHSNLRLGANLTSTVELKANARICGQGLKLVGNGFYVDESFDPGPVSPASGYPVVRRIISPRDVLQGSSGRYVIDFFGLDEKEACKVHPHAFQQVLDRVKPLRDQNRRKSIRELWWRFAWERPVIREAIRGQRQYFVTLETSKHRFFTAIPGDCLWDGSLFAIASSDYFVGGVLSSRTHIVWALASGGRLGVGNDPRYIKTRCFETFPFPDATDAQKGRIRDLGEQLDTHRKRQQALHPKLTMTGMYNVLEKLRAGEPLMKKEQQIHEQGLVSVLKQIHDDLDAAVAEAYGWPADLTDEEILERLVALNHERAEEERRGLIRWLRPEFQNPDAVTQKTLTKEPSEPVAATKPAAKLKKQPWPKTLSAQAAAVQSALATLAAPADESNIAKHFTRAKKERIVELLDTLTSLGKARELEDGRYVAT